VERVGLINVLGLGAVGIDDVGIERQRAAAERPMPALGMQPSAGAIFQAETLIGGEAPDVLGIGMTGETDAAPGADRRLQRHLGGAAAQDQSQQDGDGGRLQMPWPSTSRTMASTCFLAPSSWGSMSSARR